MFPIKIKLVATIFYDLNLQIFEFFYNKFSLKLNSVKLKYGKNFDIQRITKRLNKYQIQNASH